MRGRRGRTGKYTNHPASEECTKKHIGITDEDEDSDEDDDEEEENLAACALFRDVTNPDPSEDEDYEVEKIPET